MSDFLGIFYMLQAKLQSKVGMLDMATCPALTLCRVHTLCTPAMIKAAFFFPIFFASFA